MSELAFTCAKHRVELMKKHFPEGVTTDGIKLLDDIEQLLKRSYHAGADSSISSPTWSNQSAFGYAIMAAEPAGFTEDDIQRLVRALHNRFDMVSVEEAAEYYRKSSY